MNPHLIHVVVGAGAVGLAIGSKLARAGHTCLIIEKNAEIGGETSSRNSEVIHAGLYYPPDSLKSRLCIRGKELIYGLEKKYGFREFQQCGKWIVAQSPSEAQYLEKLKNIATQTGVPVNYLSASRAKELEPALKVGEVVLESPTTGIVSSHALMSLFESHLEDKSEIALLTDVTGISKVNEDCFEVQCNSVGEPVTITCAKVINSAGLWAPRVAAMVGITQAAYFAKGNYFAYPSTDLKVSRLIYPCPSDEGSLGTHLTMDLGGRLKFGPDFEWIYPENGKEIDYKVNMKNLDRTRQSVSRYLHFDADKLVPDYSGVRPKLSNDVTKFSDFHIEEPIPGFVNLMGIESPGLTASMAIAEHVEAMVT